MGYWPIPFNTFKALGSSRPITVRVEASLSDYFNFGYEKYEYISIELKHISGDIIHGYIRHSHKDCQSLVGHLYDGTAHRITLEIFPAKAQTSCVLVTKVMSNSWVLLAPEDDGNVRKL
jgi:hypothetical protein